MRITLVLLIKQIPGFVT